MTSAGRIRLAVATIALLGFVAETYFLGGMLQWCDAYVSTAVRAVWATDLVAGLIAFSKAAPFIGAAFVIAGVVVALRSDVDVRDVAAILMQLAVGLVLAAVLKGFFERARPGAVPWDAGDSFPSGHVANALLCVGATLRLVPGWRRNGAVGWRVAFLIGSVAFVPAVAFARVALARHWLTDVTGSLLIGAALLALAPVLRPNRVLVGVLPVIALCAGVSVATGSRIRLPSPSTLLNAPREGLGDDEDLLSTIEIDDGSASSGWGGQRLTLLAPTYGKQWIDVSGGQRTILKLLARTHLDVAEVSARRLQLLVDGTVVGSQPLDTRWRTFAFALPALEPGVHEVELLALPRTLATTRFPEVTPAPGAAR